MVKTKSVNVALIGCGKIGSGFVRHYQEKRGKYQRRGIDINLGPIVDTNPKALEPFADGFRTGTEYHKILSDSSIDIVVQLIGGKTHAPQIMRDVLNSRKHLVTANKDTIDTYGPQLAEMAEMNRRCLRFGAAVGGIIPIIRNIKDELAANDTHTLFGILNGTCNYIMTQMSEGQEFEAALQGAIKQGFAEPVYKSDVEGNDTAYKFAILSSLALDAIISADQIPILEGIARVEGEGDEMKAIPTVRAEDMGYAKSMGYAIKLVGAVHLQEDGRVSIGVYPALLPLDHGLACVDESFNAIHLAGEGDVTIRGQGAGARPTAAAVMADVLSIARNPDDYESPFVDRDVGIVPREEMVSRFYLRFVCSDYKLSEPVLRDLGIPHHGIHDGA
ncbi:MAG: homoserine dehydrogenase, partial [archaeon]